MGWFDKDIYEMLRGKINETVTSLSETILSIIEEVYSEKQRKWACSQIDNPSKLSKAQAKEMCGSKGLKKELKVDDGRGGTTSGPKKCPKCDLGQKNQPCLCGKYTEPALQDDYVVDNISDEIFDEIEEISGAGAAGGYSLPLGMKPRYFNSPMPKVKGINIYNSKKKK